jgi:hypothetical protein
MQPLIPLYFTGMTIIIRQYPKNPRCKSKSFQGMILVLVFQRDITSDISQNIQIQFTVQSDPCIHLSCLQKYPISYLGDILPEILSHQKRLLHTTNLHEELQSENLNFEQDTAFYDYKNLAKFLHLAIIVFREYIQQHITYPHKSMAASHPKGLNKKSPFTNFKNKMKM